MPDIPKLLAAGREVKDRLDTLILRASVADSGEARVAATVCLTIAEQYAATLHLVDGRFSAHAPILVRSMLEGLANLLNLVKDPDYLDQLRFENARSDVTLFDGYADDPEMQEEPEAIATLKAWTEKAKPLRDELKARGFRKQDVIEKFRQAGILQNYIAYRVFCSFSHNQLTTLISRHAGKRELRYHDEPPAQLTASTLSIAVSIICRAVSTLPFYTDVTHEELRQVLDDVERIWSEAC